jgi:TatD DNase family protein
MKLIDTHAHYEDENFDLDRDELLTRILNENVEAIINIGCSLDRAKAAISLANSYNKVYAAVGIHPDDIKDLPSDYLTRLEQMAQHPKVVAIGEIGLDYHYPDFDREKQKEHFVEQIQLAKKLNLPVIIHSRDATQDTMEILREYRPSGVMHCFSESAEIAREVISLGLYISFTGVLTFKNAKRALSSCAVIPLDRLMLETDCPYMAPEPFRGKRCDSSMAFYTAKKAAEIKEVPVEDLIAQCNENARRLFQLQ